MSLPRTTSSHVLPGRFARPCKYLLLITFVGQAIFSRDKHAAIGATFALHPFVVVYLASLTTKESRPVRARGLKRYLYVNHSASIASRPVRARGLKRQRAVTDSLALGRAPCGRVD